MKNILERHKNNPMVKRNFARKNELAKMLEHTKKWLKQIK